MAGMPITDRQVRRYMEQRRLNATQAVAAAKAGFSERTARRLEGNPVLPSQRAGKRRKRTRADPFAGVWAGEIAPLSRAVPHLRGTTVLETLQRQHPGRFADGVLRRCNGGRTCDATPDPAVGGRHSRDLIRAYQPAQVRC